MWCFPSVSEQAETSPWAESCARAVTLKEKAWQLVLVSESRGSRGKVSSASNPVGAGYINSQVLSSSFPFPVSVVLIYVFSFLAVYHAIYLEEMAASEVTRKLALAFNIPLHQINQVYRQGPTGIHILVSDQVMEILFFRKKSYEFSKMEFFFFNTLLLFCLFGKATLHFQCKWSQTKERKTAGLCSCEVLHSLLALYLFWTCLMSGTA